jgi:hypothetical protein
MRETGLRVWRVTGMAALAMTGLSVAGGAARHDGTAHYAACIRNHIRWEEFPIAVYFERNRQYSPARRNSAMRGFDRWTGASGGFVRYRVTDDREEAQLTVRFDPSTNDGYTTTNFTDGLITSAAMRIGVKRGEGPDMEAIAAHEFGHALGIDGHSTVKADLMYPVHHMGTPWRVTCRDLNTLATIYPPIGAKVAGESTP